MLIKIGIFTIHSVQLTLAFTGSECLTRQYHTTCKKKLRKCFFEKLASLTTKTKITTPY